MVVRDKKYSVCVPFYEYTEQAGIVQFLKELYGRNPGIKLLTVEELIGTQQEG